MRFTKEKKRKEKHKRNGHKENYKKRQSIRRGQRIEFQTLKGIIRIKKLEGKKRNFKKKQQHEGHYHEFPKLITILVV